MKVAIIAPDKLPIPNVKGGAIETLTTHLIDQNEIMGKAELFVFSPFDSDAFEKSKKYKNTKFFFYKFKMQHILFNKFWGVLYFGSHKHILARRAFVWMCKKDLMNINPDIIIAEGSFLQIKQLKKFGKPLVLHEHTDLLNTYEPKTKEIVNLCDNVWTVSSYLKNRIAEAGADESKVKVFLNAIDTSKFISSKTHGLREKYNIPEGDKVAIYCGRVVENKGVREMIMAFEKAGVPDLTLMIIGGSRFAGSLLTDYETQLYRYVEERKLNVVFTGFIPQNDLPEYYSIADFSICPSTCNEAAGLVIVEAHCAGLPVIATDIGGIPEYINPKSSILIKYEPKKFVENLSKAITEISTNDLLRQKMRIYAIEYTNKFGLSTYYENFIELLFDLYKEKK